eukprot:gene11856-5185_t
MSYVIKATFNQENRKFKLSSQSFEELSSLLKKLFSVDESFVVQYQDEDDDLMTISSDIELKCALECEEKLKLILSLKKKNKKNEDVLFEEKKKIDECQKQETSVTELNKLINDSFFEKNKQLNDFKEEEKLIEEFSNQQCSSSFEIETTPFPSYFKDDILSQITLPQPTSKRKKKEELKERKLKYKEYAKNSIVKVT